MKLNLSHYLTTDDTLVAFKATDLNATDSATEDSLKFIGDSRKHDWLPFDGQKSKMTEREILVAFCQHVFVPLGNCVTLEPAYACDLQKLSNNVKLNWGAIGMGNEATWHGIPDGRVDSICVNRLIAEDEVDSDLEDGYEDSDGEVLSVSSTLIEAKRRLKYNNYSQLISTAFIASCIEHNLSKASRIPIIGINKHVFIVVVYYYDQDLLLISTPKSISTKERLSSSGMLLIWLTINHKYVAVCFQ